MSTLESIELLTICLKELKHGLSKVTLILVIIIAIKRCLEGGGTGE